MRKKRIAITGLVSIVAVAALFSCSRVECVRSVEWAAYTLLGQEKLSLTEEEKERAIQIALNDPRVTELLQGKNYVVAPPDEKGQTQIKLVTKERRKLGVRLAIRFDQPYFLDYDFPRDEWKENFTTYESKTRHYSGMVRELFFFIDLYIDPKGAGRVSIIAPR